MYNDDGAYDKHGAGRAEFYSQYHVVICICLMSFPDTFFFKFLVLWSGTFPQYMYQEQDLAQRKPSVVICDSAHVPSPFHSPVILTQ